MDLMEETHELTDQDFLEWFWLKDTYEAPAKVPTILILHGLEGCARSNYVQDLMRQLGFLGWRAVVMQYRNCGEKPNRLAQSYHAMRWQEYTGLWKYFGNASQKHRLESSDFQ